MAYGYFKREVNVDIFHLVTENLLEQRVPLDKQSTDNANFAKFDADQNTKNYQILPNPLVKGSASGVLCIVPTAGRGRCLQWPRRFSTIN